MNNATPTPPPSASDLTTGKALLDDQKRWAVDMRKALSDIDRLALELRKQRAGE